MTTRAFKPAGTRRVVLARASGKHDRALAAAIVGAGSALFMSNAALASQFTDAQAAKQAEVDKQQAKLEYLFEQKQNAVKAGGAAKAKVCSSALSTVQFLSKTFVYSISVRMLVFCTLPGERQGKWQAGLHIVALALPAAVSCSVSLRQRNTQVSCVCVRRLNS